MKSFLSSTHWLRYISAQRVASQVAERSFLWKIENPQPSISATLFDSSTLTSWQNTCWLITKSPELFSLHRHLSGSKSTQICLEPSTNLRVGAHKSWETLTQRESIEWGHVDSGSHRGGGMKGHSLSLGKYLKLGEKIICPAILYASSWAWVAKGGDQSLIKNFLSQFSVWSLYQSFPRTPWYDQ